MADPDFSLIIEHLKRIQDRLSRLEDGQSTILHRLNSMSTHLAAFHTNDAAQDAAIVEINVRLDRIERRLDLREEV